jgi:hypothetical protein
MHFLTFVVLAGGLVLANIGCAAGPATKVDFIGPAGASMTFEKRDFKLPATVALRRPAEVGGILRQDVEFHFPAVPTSNGSVSVDAEGVIEVLGYNESDIDRLATNKCDLTPTQLEKVIDGYAVVFEGTSPSSQKLYRMTIGKKKTIVETK